MSDANPNPEPTGGELRSQFEAQLAEQKRENAMLRAGIDLDSPLGAMFAKAYDGDLTTDAVKAAFVQLAPAAPAAPAPDPAATPEQTPPAPAPDDSALFDEAGRLIGSGTPPTGDNGPHPGRAGVDDYWSALRDGKTEEEAEALGLDRILAAGMAGDPRVSLTGRQGGE